MWRDETRIERDWSREIAAALAQSDLLCLIWTARAKDSRWVTHEWLTARALGKPILPCLTGKSPALPGPLENVQAVQLDESVHRVLDGIRQRSGPWSYDYTLHPPRFHVPFEPNRDFVGRNGDMVELYLKCIGGLNQVGRRHVGVVGMGGLGKTQLLVEFAHRFGFAFESVHWIQASDPSLWQRRLVEIARDQLGIKIASRGVDPDLGYLGALEAHFSAHPRSVIIMDNVEDPQQLHDQLPASDEITPFTLGCSMLFSTRRKLVSPLVDWLDLKELSLDAAQALLTRRRKPEGMDDKRAAKDIAAAVGCLPLALILAASFLERHPRTSYTDYLADLRRGGLETLDASNVAPAELATRHSTAVELTFKEQWRSVRDENAKRLFLLSGLHRESELIPKRRVEIEGGFEASPLRRVADEAWGVLVETSLIDEHDRARSVRLHPLLRMFAQRFLSGDGMAERVSAAAHLAEFYERPGRFETEYRERGIQAVVDDLELACEWSHPAEAPSWLLELVRVLEREREHLGPSDEEPARVANVRQQVHYRAHAMGYTDLASRFASDPPESGFRLQAITHSQKEDEGLLRVIGNEGASVNCFRVAPEQGIIVSGHEDGSLVVWNYETGRMRYRVASSRSSLTAMAIDRTARLALVGHSDGSLTFWDLSARKRLWQVARCPTCVRALRLRQGHSRRISAVAMIEERNWALSGSEDGTLVEWDLAHGHAVHTLRGHAGPITAVAATRDGTLAAAGVKSGRVIIWDLVGGEIRGFLNEKPWENHRQPDSSPSVAITDNGCRVLTGHLSDINSLLLWDVANRELLQAAEPDNPAEYLTAIDWHPELRLVLSGSLYGTVVLSKFVPETVEDPDQRKLVEVERIVAQRAFIGHTASVTAVSLIEEGRRALSASQDGRLILWNTEAAATGGDESSSRARRSAPVTALALFPTFPILLVARARGIVDVTDGTSYLKVRGGSNPVPKVGSVTFNRVIKALGVSGDGQRVLIGFDNQVRFRPSDDLRGSHRLFQGPVVWQRGIQTATLARNGVRALVVANDVLTLWDVPRELPGQLPESPRQLRQCRCPQVRKVALSSDGRVAVIGNTVGTVAVWETEGSRGPRVVGNHTTGVTALSIDKDGERALSGSKDGSLILWNLRARNAIYKLCEHEGGVTSSALSQDGRIAASTSAGGHLVVWDLDGRMRLAHLRLKDSPVAVALESNWIGFADTAGVVHLLELTGCPVRSQT